WEQGGGDGRVRGRVEDQERPVTGAPRPTRAIWRLCATTRPAASHTTDSSSNQPPSTSWLAVATRRSPRTGTARMYQVSSTVGAQPRAPRLNTTGGRPPSAGASR